MLGKKHLPAVPQALGSVPSKGKNKEGKIKDLKAKPGTMELLDETRGKVSRHCSGQLIFWLRLQKYRGQRREQTSSITSDLIGFCTAKETIHGVCRGAEGEETLANYPSDQGLIAPEYKALKQQQNVNHPLKTASDLKRHFSKEGAQTAKYVKKG